MGITHPIGVRSVSLAVAALIAGSLLVAVPTAASADTAPITGTPATVSTDILPTPQIDGPDDGGVVWTQLIVGNTVYVGGSFTEARPYGAAEGVSTVARSNIMGYDITTGAMTSFAPVLNGQVRGLAASPDGTRLYVVGEFTSVDSTPRSRIAAFDTATGGLITSFAPAANTRVNTVLATDTAVYVGGWLTSVKSGSTTYPRTYAAALSATDGSVLPFNPTIAGGTVQAMVLSPDRSQLIIGGNFTTVSGSEKPGYGLASLNPTTGASLPLALNNTVRDAGVGSGITSLAADADSFYGTGYLYSGNGGKGNLEGAFRANWSDGTLNWVEDCHGDSYSIAPVGDVVYTVSHAHFCGNVGGFPQQLIGTTDKPMTQRAMAWTKTGSYKITSDTQGYANWAGKTAPAILNWWPDLTTGQASGQGQAAWSVAANSNYVVLGGEFKTVNNKAQQGLVRFAVSSIAPDLDGPRLKGADYVPAATSVSSGAVNVTWPANYDRDNEFLTYELIRDGAVSTPVTTKTVASRIWYDRPVMTFLDQGLTPGQTYTYRVKVTDPNGNTVQGADVSVTASATGNLSAYRKAVTMDSPKAYWRLGETGTTTVYDSSTNLNALANPNVVRGGAGAIAGDTDKASSFNGTNSLASSQTAIWGPDRMAVEAWFKSSSTTGGKIVGFGNRNTGVSSAYDRDVYLDTAGVISFGVNSTGDRRVQSAAGFNDGKWHHVVANLSAAGEELYVDGVKVSSRADAVSGREIFGFWRIGGDASRQGSSFFNGSIDEVAVYDQPLSAAAISRHFGIGTGTIVNAAPTAAFTATATGLSASVDASSSADSDGTIAAYSWDFGNGQTATGKTATATYATAGTYPVTLTVTDDGGLASSSAQTVTVEAPNGLPTAAFTAATSDLVATVDGTSSSDPDGSIAAYSWSFGDGGTATTATASHTYAAAGTFTITLTVTDNRGGTATTSKTVTVTPAGVAVPLAQDTFGRTSTASLGTADIGGNWTTAGTAANFAVNTGTGRITSSAAGSTLTGYLGGVSSTNTEVTATTSLLQASSGSGTYVSVIGRRVGSANYQARVKVLASGSTTLQLMQTGTTLSSVTVPGLSYATGDKLQLRLQVTGTAPTTIKAKVWKVGTTEPSGWQLTTTDATAALQTAGSVGIATYVSGTSTVPLTVTFDDFWAGTPAP